MEKIEIKNLNKKFGDIEAISNFSYAFESGKKYFIVGPTGSGKTTLLNILAGIESADGKSVVKIDGTNRNSLSIESAKISYVLSEPLFFNRQNVYKNLEYQAKICGKNLTQRDIEELANKFNLDPSEKVKRLTYIEKLFLSFARIEIKNSDIVLIDFDDFFENVDLKSDAFRMVVSWIENYSGTIVAVENGLNLASFCAGEIIFLNFGVNKGEISLKSESENPTNFYLQKCIKKLHGEKFREVNIIVEKTMCGTAINSSGLTKEESKRLVSIADRMVGFRTGESMEVVMLDDLFFEKIGGKILN